MSQITQRNDQAEFVNEGDLQDGKFAGLDREHWE